MSGHYAMLWSGGKDSALALHRARSLGLRIARLVTFFDRTTGRVRFHATRLEMLEAQAASAGIELDAIGTTWPEMEAALRTKLRALSMQGFAGVVLGDVHLADVRAWYEDRVTAAGLEHVEPIWGESPQDLVREFVAGGGRAVITCVDLDRLGRHWLGRVIDAEFPNDIAREAVDPCGENGEFHSFAFDGPAFRRRVAWEAGAQRLEGNFAQLDLLPVWPAVS